VQNSRFVWLALAVWLPLSAAHADDAPTEAATEVVTEAPTEAATPIVEDVAPEPQGPSGRELFAKFLENRQLRSAISTQTIEPLDDPSDDPRTFEVRFKTYAPDDEDHADLLAKTVVRMKAPESQRGSNVLVIAKRDGSAETFVAYRGRRVRRMPMFDVTVLGEVFDVEDFVYRDLQNADYVRLDDTEIAGVPVYVVEASLKPFVRRSYVRSIVYLEHEHHVALREEFFDSQGQLTRIATADPESIQEFGGLWLPGRTEMEDKRNGSTSALTLIELEPNPELGERHFTPSVLQTRR